MTDITRVETLPDFDPAEHLKDANDIAAYLSAVLEEDDPSEVIWLGYFMEMPDDYASGVFESAALQ